MDTFYFLRHGQTDANRQGLMCGSQWDIGLNETGKTQARQAAELLSTVQPIGSLCVSPMFRTRQTAEIVNAVLRVPVLYLDELTEWDIGSWNRLPFAEVKNDFLADIEPPGGETRTRFRERVSLALKKCSAAGQPPILISHGAVWLFIQKLLALEPTRSENGAIFAVYRLDSKWIAKRI
jgi:broad specificity phosphatase PhoE